MALFAIICLLALDIAAMIILVYLFVYHDTRARENSTVGWIGLPAVIPGAWAMLLYLVFRNKSEIDPIQRARLHRIKAVLSMLFFVAIVLVITGICVAIK